MNVTTNLVLAALIGILAGVGGTLAVAGIQERRPTADSYMMNNGAGGMHGAMDDMMSGLDGKTGDDFDRAFLSEMIAHHEGAVAMAQAALKNAQHAEITTMANAIISAQTAEIAQMKGWQKSWYGN